jgi:hypothetical protein
MKPVSIVTILILLVVLGGATAFTLPGVFGSTDTLSGQPQTEAEVPIYEVKLPPKSLDQYYPPQTEVPEYLFAMFELEGPFGALGTSLADGNMENAQLYYGGLKEKYAELSEMVPEWSEEYWPSEPLDQLGEALQGTDPAAIGQAMGGVGAVCGRCHHDNRPGVWYRYRWGDFEEVTIDDPVSGETLEWEDYMFALADGFSGTGTYLAEGRLDKAREAIAGFQARFDGLQQGCESCHGEGERPAFLTSETKGLLAAAAAELNQEQPDPGKVNELVMEFGMESCYECHVVHQPAAVVQHTWAPEHDEHE